jgi:hypothetical protein
MASTLFGSQLTDGSGFRWIRLQVRIGNLVATRSWRYTRSGSAQRFLKTRLSAAGDAASFGLTGYHW